MSDMPIATHRAMRARLRAALRRGLLALVDVGAAKTVCMVLRVDAQRLARAQEGGAAHDCLGAVRVIGVGVTRSHGVRLGEIVDMEEASRSLRNALELAEKMAGERVDDAIATLSAARPLSIAAYGAAPLDGLEVAERDIASAVAACRPDPGPGRELLHAQPVGFAVDGAGGVADPRGMSGTRLHCDLHALSVATGPLRNLAYCVRRADLTLAGVVSAPYAAGLSGLVEDEKRLGAACVEMGAGATGLSVFLGGHLIHVDSVRVGGDHLTRDIAHGLGVSEPDAERMKTLHGGAVATGLDDREMIDVPAPPGDEIDNRRRVSRAVLIGVIRPRLEEILEASRDRLRDAGFDQLPGRRIVLTGGAAQLPGLEEAARRVLGRRTRIGKPLRIAGLPQNASGPAFAAIVGLGVYAARPPRECWDYDAPLAPSGRGRMARAMRWFKDNW